MTPAVARLDAWVAGSSRWLGAAGLLLLALNALAVVVDVLLRALANAPIDRLSDVSSVVYYVAAACCLPAATAGRRHITIRALDGLLLTRGRALLDGFAAALTAAVFGIFAVQAVLYAQEMARTNRTLSQIDLSIAPFWSLVAAMVAFNFLAQLCVTAMHLRAAWSAPRG